MGEHLQRYYEFGPFRLDVAERVLLREGEPVPLTPKAFDLLVLLVGRGGRLVEKEYLLRTLWPDTAAGDSNLNRTVSTLRKALGEGSGGHHYLETIPKHGYRFKPHGDEAADEGEELVLEKHTLTRAVTEEEVLELSEQAEAATQHAPGPSAAVSAGTRRTWRARTLAVVMVGASLLAAGAATAGGIYWLEGQRRPRERATSHAPFGEMEISRLTTSGKIIRAAISPDGRYVAYVTEDTEGGSLWVKNVAAPSSVRIAGPAASTQYVWATFAPDGDSVYYLSLEKDKSGPVLNRVPVLGGPSSRVAQDVGPMSFSPDRRWITFIRMYDEESNIVVAGADGSDERTLATLRQPDFFRQNWNAPAWSPDGKTIACQVRLSDERGHYETVLGLGVEDGSRRPLTSGRWHYVGQPTWLADGSGLLVPAGEDRNAPRQVWRISLESGQATRVTHDLNDYHDLSLTGDSSRLAAVQDHSVSSIWVAQEGDAGGAKQIASDAGWIEEVAWTPDGRIAYRSNTGGAAEIWMMNADGSNPRQLTSGARVAHGLTVSPDGAYIFFSSERAGHLNIWRVNSDGADLKQLTAGDGERYPQCTPDGRWVVYQRGEVEPSLWKVRVDGGEPVRLTETRASRPAVSPDGQLIAYHYLDPERERWGIGIVSSEGGRRIKRFDFPPTVTWRFVRWSPDPRAIAYANSPGGLTDIWLQPLDGDRPRRLTDFKTGQILAFDWSRDGRRLVMARGAGVSDIVMMRDIR